MRILTGRIEAAKPRPVLACCVLLFGVCLGCHHLGLDKLDPRAALPTPPPEVPVSNPAHVGLVEPEFLWRMVVDAVDDHFKVESEQQVRRDNESWLEGQLTTFPAISGTTFEPWRNDAARGFERLQSTFMTVRRTARVRVIPEPTGYQIEIEVIKEQEDVDQSQFATAGAAAQRHDGGIVRNQNQMRQTPITLGWYEIGRDRELENRIMAGILGRITNNKLPPKHRLLP